MACSPATVPAACVPPCVHTSPHSFIPPLPPTLTSCLFIPPHTHLSTHACSYHPCSFVPPTLICTPVAAVPACCHCSCCWCLIHRLSPLAFWFTCTRWFTFVFAFIGPGSNLPPLLAGSWFVFAFTFVGPGSYSLPLLLVGLLVHMHWLVHIRICCRCCCWHWGCCCCHGCSRRA